MGEGVAEEEGGEEEEVGEEEAIIMIIKVPTHALLCFLFVDFIKCHGSLSLF